MSRVCQVKIVINPVVPPCVKFCFQLETGKHEIRLHSRSMADVRPQIESLQGMLCVSAQLEFCKLGNEPMSRELRQLWREVLGGEEEPEGPGAATAATSAAGPPPGDKKAKKQALLSEPHFLHQVEVLRQHIATFGAAPDMQSRRPANIPKIRNYMTSVLADPTLTTERALQIATALAE